MLSPTSYLAKQNGPKSSQQSTWISNTNIALFSPKARDEKMNRDVALLMSQRQRMIHTIFGRDVKCYPLHRSLMHLRQGTKNLSRSSFAHLQNGTHPLHVAKTQTSQPKDRVDSTNYALPELSCPKSLDLSICRSFSIRNSSQGHTISHVLMYHCLLLCLFHDMNPSFH